MRRIIRARGFSLMELLIVMALLGGPHPEHYLAVVIALVLSLWNDQSRKLALIGLPYLLYALVYSPTLVLSFGPRSRAPSLMKIGELQTSRMVMLLIVTSSSSAPSTDSSARPRQ